MQLGGRQWRGGAGGWLPGNRLAVKEGASYVVDQVLLTGDGTTVKIGQPYCAGAKVVCEVLEHSRGPKVISYKFRRRENYRKTRGHRQELTHLLVKDISV